VPEKTLPLNASIVDSNEISSYVPNFVLKVGTLGTAKRGDFVRILTKMQVSHHTGDPGEVMRESEFVSCVVTGKTPAGLLKCKVFSRPEKTHLHSIEYGDELTLSERYILSHEPATDQTVAEVEPFLTGVRPQPIPINSEDAKLREASQKLPPLAPQPGRRYWLRNGALVMVWTYQTQKAVLCSACSRQLLGSNIQNEQCPVTRTYHSWVEQERSVWLGGGDDGSAIEWNPDGSHAGGMRDLDIVKDPKASEVVA
jgi:hypothetical protein